MCALDNPSKPRARRALTNASSSGALTFLSSAASQRSTMLSESPSLLATESLEDWIYWQRDATKPQCWTKVYAVLDNEFLWLFKGNHSHKTMFLQIAVASVEVSGERQLRIVDPNGEDMEIWLLDTESFVAWRLRLEEASALTSQFFRMTEIEARRLPRSSAYRGSLVTYRRASKRARCKAALDWVATQWRRNFVPSNR